MQVLEAITRVLAMADEPTGKSAEPEQDQVALSIVYSMLNTALPVAKYRAFVEVVGEQPKRTAFEASRAVRDEFTICSPDIEGIIAGLVGLHHVPTNCRVTLFEQRETGADMLTGYQGLTKGHTPWRLFLEQLPVIDRTPRATPVEAPRLNPTIN